MEMKDIKNIDLEKRLRTIEKDDAEFNNLIFNAIVDYYGEEHRKTINKSLYNFLVLKNYHLKNEDDLDASEKWCFYETDFADIHTTEISYDSKGHINTDINIYPSNHSKVKRNQEIIKAMVQKIMINNNPSRIANPSSLRPNENNVTINNKHGLVEIKRSFVVNTNKEEETLLPYSEENYNLEDYLVLLDSININKILFSSYYVGYAKDKVLVDVAFTIAKYPTLVNKLTKLRFMTYDEYQLEKESFTYELNYFIEYFTNRRNNIYDTKTIDKLASEANNSLYRINSKKRALAQ